MWIFLRIPSWEAEYVQIFKWMLAEHLIDYNSISLFCIYVRKSLICTDVFYLNPAVAENLLKVNHIFTLHFAN